MTPDLPTLLGCSAAVFLLLGVHFVLAEFAGRRWSGMAYYPAPFFLAALSALFFIASVRLPGLWAPRAGGLFMVIAYGAGWQALRVMLGCPPDPKFSGFNAVLLCSAASFLLSLLPESAGWSHAVNTSFRLGVVALFHCLAARDLQRTVRIRTPAKRSLLRLLRMSAVFHGVLAGLCLWRPGPFGSDAEAIWPVIGYSFLALIEVALFALSLIAIPWEQLAFRQQELILQDPLSGGSNRRAFQSWLDNDGKICGHEALLMIDIDHFKSINDAYGHAIGDQIIIAMGRVCTEILYPTTVFFRVGGDEFVVVFQCDTVEEMLATAQRLRKAFSTETRLIAGGHLTASLSIGAALCQGNGMTRTELLEMADSALYAAKQAGRNRVVRCPGRTETSISPLFREPARTTGTGS